MSALTAWYAVFCGVLVLLAVAAITGYLEGSGRRVLPRPSRPRLPRRDRRMPRITATVWGATRRPARRALPAAAARPLPAQRAAALSAAPSPAGSADRVIRGEVLR